MRPSRNANQIGPEANVSKADISKRRSDRISLIIPISVSGNDATGKPFSEDASTVMVSSHGAAIGLKTSVKPGWVVLLRRRHTRETREVESLVVGQSGIQGGLKIINVAFLKPMLGFWDVYFPPLPADSNTAGRVLLGCRVCGARRIVHLELEGLAAYNARHQLSLHCETCQKVTVWLESLQETAKPPSIAPANPARLAHPHGPGAYNQRKHRRVAVDVPVCVRQAGAEDTVAITVDISRGGMRFASTRHFPTGTYVQVAVPYSPTAVNVFVDARIMHSAEVPDQGVYSHGIMYLAENDSSD